MHTDRKQKAKKSLDPWVPSTPNEGIVERRVGAPAIEGTIRDVAAVDVVPDDRPVGLDAIRNDYRFP